ncbi:hypothetical protein ACHAXR_003999 [Thalassiosira sp. AJA248-18]
MMTAMFLMMAALVIYQIMATFLAQDGLIENDDINPEDDTTKSKESIIRQEIDKQKYWQIQMLDEGDHQVDCQIFTTPIVSDESPPPLSSTPSSMTTPIADYNQKEQYVIHVHGLHHSGTGFLRQTLYDALNSEFSQGDSDANYPVASMHDSVRPYHHLSEALGKDKLYRQYHVPEDEGHHLQSVYPRFFDRLQESKKSSKMSMKDAIKLAYLADLCITVPNNDNVASPHPDGDDLSQSTINRQVGNILLQQWSRYWDTSAKFLLQKSPTLDVLFLEKTKILPTLHVIIVRHPMTSNSWNRVQMSQIWTGIMTHVFELLAQGEIEWYAVVSYEALIQYHDVVVEELLEVVRSGMMRYQKKGRTLRRSASNGGNVESKIVDVVMKTTRQSTQRPNHRRLPYSSISHPVSQSSSQTTESLMSYLIPKESNVELWKECTEKSFCNKKLKRLTKEVLPFFGYVSMNPKNVGRNGPQAALPLSSSPMPVTVSKQFGHVLFSSEGNALGKFRLSREGTTADIGNDYKPPLELISRMKGLLK